MGFSLKNYALKWVMQRITASLLIPLTFWFIYSAISLSKMEYDETISFFQSYLNSLLFYVMMIAMLLHAKLGLQTIIDDYVTSKKIYNLSKWGINLTSYFLMILLTIFIIKTAIFNINKLEMACKKQPALAGILIKYFVIKLCSIKS